MRALALAALLLAAAPAAAQFDMNGVALGANEAAVRRAFPGANCKRLEWESMAADRRCDDANAAMNGIGVRVTFYLKKDAVEAFDVRFSAVDLDALVAHLKARYGPPTSESRDVVEGRGKRSRRLYRALWERDGARATLTARLDRRTGTLLVYRGNFEEEIYRVR